jgi:hypothetical protein
MSGAPGHCVTRSGLIAASLLAAGIPARVAQFLMREGKGGHTVVEVWEPAEGWSLIDPTFGGTFQGNANDTSAAAAISSSAIAWHADSSWGLVGSSPTIYDRGFPLRANVIYPDPWLYTRVGRRNAPPLFLGRYVLVGPTSLRLGTGQRLLQVGIPVTFLVFALLCVKGFRGLIRTRRSAALAVSPVTRAPLSQSSNTPADNPPEHPG